MKRWSLKICFIAVLCLLIASCGGMAGHSTIQYTDGQAVRNPPDPAAVDWARKSAESLNAGNWAEAIRCASTALRIDSSMDDAYLDRARAYYQKGFFDEAAMDCSRAIAINWKNAAAYNCRGLAYIEKGQLDKALSDLKMAYEMDKEDPVTIANYGSLYERMGNTEGALAWYKRACDLSNKAGCESYKQLAGFYPAGASVAVDRLNDETYDAFTRGAWDAAIEKSTMALRLDPSNVIAFTNRAGAYANKKILNRATEDCEKAITLDPDYGLAYNNRAYVKEIAGQIRQAQLDYEIGCNLGVELACVNVKRLSGK